MMKISHKTIFFLDRPSYLITKFFALLMMVLMFSAHPAHARQGTAKVGVNKNAAIVYLDESGEYCGLAIDILTHIVATETGFVHG